MGLRAPFAIIGELVCIAKVVIEKQIEYKQPGGAELWAYGLHLQ